MRKYYFMVFAALMLLGAGSVSAQDKSKDKDEDGSYVEGHYKGDYHCWRAWRKNEKVAFKLAQAEEMDYYRPWAAERKRRAAYRKAYRRDMLENDHRTGYGHDWWGWGYRWRRDYWY